MNTKPFYQQVEEWKASVMKRQTKRERTRHSQESFEGWVEEKIQRAAHGFTNWDGAQDGCPDPCLVENLLPKGWLGLPVSLRLRQNYPIAVVISPRGSHLTFEERGGWSCSLAGAGFVWQFFPDTDPRRLDINSIVEICPEVEKCEVTGKTPFSLGGWG